MILRIFSLTLLLGMPLLANQPDDVWQEMANIEDTCSSAYLQPQTDHWFFSTDLLYWKVHDKGQQHFSSCSQLQGIRQHREHRPSFKSQTGLRFGLGYDFVCSGWDAVIYLTHLQAGSARQNGIRHKAHWQIEYDVVDFIVGRSLYESGWGSWRPFGGLRMAWIDKKRIHSALNDNVSTGGLTNSIANMASQQLGPKEQFKGCGPQLGSEVDWRAKNGFSVYGSIALAALWGHFNIICRQMYTTTDTAQLFRRERHFQAVPIVVDTALGARWQGYLSDGIIHLALQVAWEQHHFFNYRYKGRHGDLDLGGATLSASVYY